MRDKQAREEAADEALRPEHRSWLGKFERHLMAFSMGLLCLITMANVVVRYFTDFSFAATEEISVTLLVIMTLVGTSHAFATRHHIAITFFVGKTHKRQMMARKIGLFASLVLFTLLSIFSVLMAWDDYRFEVTSPSLGIPQWIYTACLPILSCLIVVRLLGLMAKEQAS